MSAQRDNLLKRCPCAETKWTKCPHAWHLAMRHDGKRFAVSLDKYAKRRGLDQPRTRGAAETLGERITKEIETGTYQEKPKPVAPAAASDSTASVNEALTFAQAWPKFVTGVLKATKVGSYKDEEGRLGKLAAADVEGETFGSKPLASITEDDVEQVFITATDDLADETRRKYRMILQRFFRWAVRKAHLATSPLTEETVMHAGTSTMRTRRVRPDEEANLLQAASEGRSDAALRLTALIVAALQLGARLGELLALQWRDVLWTEGRVFIRAEETGARKNGKSRHVPLTALVEEWLLKLLALHPAGKPWAGTDYVFGNAVGERVASVRKAWVTCVLRAHNVLPAWTGTALAAGPREAFASLNLHFHDLRHECALRWLSRGYDLNTIAKLLGHSDLNTLRVYLGITEEDAIEQAERLNAAQGFAPEASARQQTGSKPAANGRRGRLLPHVAKGGARRQLAG